MHEFHDFKAELEYIELLGRQAALADQTREANPYNQATDVTKYNAWIAGYKRGRREAVDI